jgi:hypothetical protein
MNFTEAVNEVIEITKRPDKVSSIRREVNAAINWCCTDTDFARDRNEQTVAISSSAYAGNILLSAFTRFRKIDAIRPSARNKTLDNLDPRNIFAKGKEQTDVYYIAGLQLNYKLCKLDSSLLVAYYSYPPALINIDTFWLLDVSPYMIIDRAAAKLFNDIGDDRSSKLREGYFREAYASAVSSHKYSANPR